MELYNGEFNMGFRGYGPAGTGRRVKTLYLLDFSAVIVILMLVVA